MISIEELEIAERTGEQDSKFRGLSGGDVWLSPSIDAVKAFKDRENGRKLMAEWNEVRIVFMDGLIKAREFM